MSESPSQEASGQPDFLIIYTGRSDRSARSSMNGKSEPLLLVLVFAVRVSCPRAGLSGAVPALTGATGARWHLPL